MFSSHPERPRVLAPDYQKRFVGSERSRCTYVDTGRCLVLLIVAPTPLTEGTKTRRAICFATVHQTEPRSCTLRYDTSPPILKDALPISALPCQGS